MRAATSAFSIGRTRVIIPDMRSFRDSEAGGDGPGKQLLGREQLAWVVTQVASALGPAGNHTLVVLVSELPWLVKGSKWGAFEHERRALLASLRCGSVVPSAPECPRQPPARLDRHVVIVSGDAHMVAVDDGSGSPGGLPLFQGAAIDAPPSLKGGPYSHGAFAGNGQWATLSVTDLGQDAGVVVSGVARRQRHVVDPLSGAGVCVKYEAWRYTRDDHARRGDLVPTRVLAWDSCWPTSGRGLAAAAAEWFADVAGRGEVEVEVDAFGQPLDGVLAEGGADAEQEAPRVGAREPAYIGTLREAVSSALPSVKQVAVASQWVLWHWMFLPWFPVETCFAECIAPHARVASASEAHDLDFRRESERGEAGGAGVARLLERAWPSDPLAMAVDCNCVPHWLRAVSTLLESCANGDALLQELGMLVSPHPSQNRLAHPMLLQALLSLAAASSVMAVVLGMACACCIQSCVLRSRTRASAVSKARLRRAAVPAGHAASPGTKSSSEAVAVIGLMSGTSRDGMDAAAILTDGVRIVAKGPAVTVPYEKHQADALLALISQAQAEAERAGGAAGLPCMTAGSSLRAAAEEVLASTQIRAVREVLGALRAGSGGGAVEWPEVSLIGAHGHTIMHRPAGTASGGGYTLQLSTAHELAEEFGLPVVHDFRSRDVSAGGQGAPLAPVYHAAMAMASAGLTVPEGAGRVAFLNLGGVANVTLVACSEAQLGAVLEGAGGSAGASALVAFDCGPGNALIDDWVAGAATEDAVAGAVDDATRLAAREAGFDVDGRIAAAGRPDEGLVRGWLERDAFASKPAPKSLDRDDYAWVLGEILGSAATLESGAASLTLFTARTAAAAISRAASDAQAHADVGCPGEAGVEARSSGALAAVVVCGGGAYNPTLMRMLREELAARGCHRCAVASDYGWDASAVEAQAFGFMAVRSLRSLPLSFPGTTGVETPTSGGRIVEPGS
jgi:anhydro-N-acetylmuramic acid kinase